MDIDIKEFSHDYFLRLPDKERITYLIIDLLDEKGKIWCNKPPAPRIKAVKLLSGLSKTTSWENIYLDFYNLDAENREACYEFIIQHNIMQVKKQKIYDESKAPMFTVGDLQKYHFLYEKHVDFLIQQDSAEKLATHFEQLEKEAQKEDTDYSPGGVSYSPGMIYQDINKHLKRCYQMLGLGGDDEARYYDRHHGCEDFLALCYFQMTDTVINREIDIQRCKRNGCNNIFLKSRKQKYCDTCKAIAKKEVDNQGKREAAKRNHQRLVRLIDEWLSEKSEKSMTAYSLMRELKKISKLPSQTRFRFLNSPRSLGRYLNVKKVQDMLEEKGIHIEVHPDKKNKKGATYKFKKNQ